MKFIEEFSKAYVGQNSKSWLQPQKYLGAKQYLHYSYGKSMGVDLVLNGLSQDNYYHGGTIIALIFQPCGNQHRGVDLNHNYNAR